MSYNSIFTIEDFQSIYVQELDRDITLNIRFNVEQQHDTETNTVNLIFSNFELSYDSSEEIEPWIGQIEGNINVYNISNNLTTEIFPIEIITTDGSYLDSYKCQMELNKYNSVNSINLDTPWEHTISGLEYDENGDLSIRIIWSDITDTAILSNYNISVNGSKILTFSSPNTTYTITYDNSDLLVSNLPDPQSKIKNVDLILSDLIPIKPSEYNINENFLITIDANGALDLDRYPLHFDPLQPTYNIDYIFDHWNTQADGTGTRFYPGSKIFTNQDVILYAQWEKTITHNPIIFEDFINPEYIYFNLKHVGYSENNTEYPTYYFNNNYYFDKETKLYAIWTNNDIILQQASIENNNTIITIERLNSFTTPNRDIFTTSSNELVSYYKGDLLKIIAEPLIGYELLNIKVENLEIESGSEYTVPSSEFSLIATAIPKQYYLKIKQSTGINLKIEVINSPKGGQLGNIIPYLDDEYQYYGLMAGDTIKFTYELEDEYQVEDFSINGKQIWNGDTYTLSDEGEDINLNALAGKIIHITWFKKKIKILNKIYSPFIYKNNKFERVRPYLPVFPLEFYTSELQGVYTSENQIFKIYNYRDKNSKAIVGQAIVGIIVIGEGA